MNAINVTTRSFDAGRSGANLQETVLTPQAVKTQGIKLAFTLDMPDDARGTEASALIAAGINTRDGMKRNLVYFGSMGNYVRCWDADTGELIWDELVGDAIPGTKAMDMYQINDHWGILSTGVINLKLGCIHVVAMTSPTGQFSDSHHVLHSLSLVDGGQVLAPLDLSAATYQPPGGLKLQRMSNVPRKQRCALALDERNGRQTVFVANGSFLESADTNQGWLIAVDLGGYQPTIAAAITTTARYSGGGIWMGAQGPTIDQNTGDVLLVVGNGAFDGVTDFGESVVRYAYQPPSGTAPGALTVKDWFTPYTDAGRVGGNPTSPTAKDDDAAPGGTSNMDDPGDEDLNSGGPALLSTALTGLGKEIIYVAGKDGIGYCIDANNMGKPQLADFAPDRIKEHVYAKLLSPPIGFTYYPAGMDCAPTDLTKIQTTYGGFTHHQHGTPTFWKSQVHGPMLFTWGENGNLRAWRINADFTLTYLACSAEMASPWYAQRPPGGMPGGLISLSANGSQGGVVWALVPYGNANSEITPGRLLAYDAENFGRFDNGASRLMPLWDSADWNIQFKHNKFDIPVAANGKVYVPAYDGRVLVFELA